MNNQEAVRALHELMSNRPDEVVEIALAARAAVKKAAKGVSEMIYATYAISSVATFTGKLGQAFIHISTYANHVNLGFNHGAKLVDEDSILEGTGKQIRHVRLNSKADLKKPAVKKLIVAAIEQGREMAEAKGGVQPASIVVVNGKKK